MKSLLVENQPYVILVSFLFYNDFQMRDSRFFKTTYFGKWNPLKKEINSAYFYYKFVSHKIDLQFTFEIPLTRTKIPS